jgi:hypothetical protein
MFIRFVTALSCFLIVSNAFGATADRTNTAGRFAVEINGNSLGFVKSIEGGGMYADVIEEAAAPNGATPKHLGAVRCEDITLRVGLQENVVPDMVQALLSGKPQPMNCTLIDADFDYKIRTQTQFKNATLSEFTLPALDGSSKEAGYFTLKLTPESGTISGGSGQTYSAKVGAKQKAWMTSNFRIDIDGIPTTRVARIEPLTFRMPIAGGGGGAGGVQREPVKQPGVLALPTLRLSVSQADAALWRAWFEQFVLKGNNGPANEKKGSITLLAPDMKTSLLTFNLYNIGIARLAEAPREANSEKIARFEADLYFERIEIAGAGNEIKTKPPEDPVAQNTAAAPTTAPAAAASQPAAQPTASNPPTRMQTPITRTLGAATETEAYTIKPNLKLLGETGRLVVRFPEGIRKRDNQRIQFPKAKDEKNSEINWGSVAKETPPGDYLVTINGKLIEGVKVQAGADTQVRVGILRLELPDNQTWELIEEDLDSAPAIFYAGGPADIGLPVGTYYVRTKSEISPVKIEDGKIATFGGAAATPADAAIKK